MEVMEVMAVMGDTGNIMAEVTGDMDMEDIMEVVAMDMEAMEEEDMVIMLEVMVTEVEAMGDIMGDIMGDTEND